MKKANSFGFIDGIEHLHGSLFKVKFAKIATTDKVEESSGYVFSNPRLLTQNGTDTLTDRSLSLDLRENIKHRTLLTPLICRWIGDGGNAHPQLVGGDRRYRALDYLISKKEMVVDPRESKFGETTSEREMVSADIAYEYVVCQIFSCSSDLEAATLAWAENKNRINLTDGHEVAAVREFRLYGATDDQILETLQQDSKWLHETDELLEKIDEDTLSQLCEDKIKRSVAIQLLKIDDLEKRSEVLNAAIVNAQESHSAKASKLDKQLDAVKNKRGRAETKKVIAESNNDETLLRQSKKVIDRAEEREKEIQNKKSKTKPIASTKNLKQAMAEVGVEENLSARAGIKSIKKVLTTIQSIIDKDGVVDILGEDNSFQLDPVYLELLKFVLENHALKDSDSLKDTLEQWRAEFPDFFEVNSSVSLPEASEVLEADEDEADEDEADEDEADEDEADDDEDEEEDEEEDEVVSSESDDEFYDDSSEELEGLVQDEDEED